MFLNILKILASDVLKMFLNIIVSTCIGCVVVILHSYKPATSSILNWPLSATLAAGGVLPYIGYTRMCRWKGYGFQATYPGISSSNHRKLV